MTKYSLAFSKQEKLLLIFIYNRIRMKNLDSTIDSLKFYSYRKLQFFNNYFMPYMTYMSLQYNCKSTN